MITTVLLVVDILVCIALVGLILIQHGKGADAGAAFGSGASQTVFGSGGSASFLTRTTAILAVIFFVISLALAYLSSHTPRDQSVVGSVPAQAPVSQGLPPAPVSDVPSAPGENNTGLPARVPVTPPLAPVQPAPAPAVP